MTLDLLQSSCRRDKWRTDKWGVFSCDTPLFGALLHLSIRCIYFMSPLYCKVKSCAREHWYFVFHWDLRGIHFYVSRLLSTLWFPWPQRLKVTQWGQCSQRFPHQPRWYEFLTFLFVMFLPNIKVPNIVLDTFIVIKVLLNSNNLFCEAFFGHFSIYNIIVPLYDQLSADWCLLKVQYRPIIHFVSLPPDACYSLSGCVCVCVRFQWD